MPYVDPVKRSEANKRYYQKYKQRRAEINREYRTKIKQTLKELKESEPCTDCGNYFPHYVMDYDHQRDKVIGVSAAITQGWSLKKIMEEIEKCELVCANCHRERTHGCVSERPKGTLF